MSGGSVTNETTVVIRGNFQVTQTEIFQDYTKPVFIFKVNFPVGLTLPRLSWQITCKPMNSA